ncbi:MAG: tRNA pseudouridine(38-40) synthase TruA [Anaerosomatales bacterium]|nr:tRNA pseudouridine(38-40) synthase TruA [Anaerosomatales bacterium]MDT8434353.1 tRNA pseudouridine(38-40) synthase TruA [Anaerosomatales bacterium]
MDTGHQQQGALALTIAYDGAPFSGFARQPGRETVQGSIEQALAVVLRREVVTVGAGRTDAGVHALGQVVSFESDGSEPELRTLVRSLNALVCEGVVVTGVCRAAAGFSARFDAEAREYRYRLVPGPTPPLFLDEVAWWVRHTVDLGAMRAAAASLVGEHDFRSFCVAGSAEGRSTRRSIELVEIVPEEHLGEHCVTVRVVGNAFLHSMVRVIVGSLVEVGLGRRDPEWIADVLGACDRSAAGPTAPACGLTLWHVSYPEECWL